MYDGVCSKCGTPLLAGTVAVSDRSSKSIHCVECPDLPPTVERDPPVIDFGPAGQSARREHERLAMRRETAVKSRWGDRIGGWILKLSDEPQSIRAWDIGARGEEKLGEALGGIAGLQVLHDRRVPGKNGNIDHIVIAPAGVFVVDAKHYDGLIETRNHSWFFRPDNRLTVGRRDRSNLARDMAWQVEVVASALLPAGIDPLPSITPVLCFVDGQWPIFNPPKEFEGVLLESERSIVGVVTRSGGIDAPSIERLTVTLARALPPN